MWADTEIAKNRLAGTVLWAPPKAIFQDLSGHRPVGTTENLFMGTAENKVGNKKTKTLVGTIVYHSVGAAGSRSKGTNVGTVFIIHSITNS